eukprot:scaffold1.g5530.t1
MTEVGVGFLFGNVDENNRVDADYLDQARDSRRFGGCWCPAQGRLARRRAGGDAKDHLAALATMAGGRELQEDVQQALEEGPGPGVLSTAPSAASAVGPVTKAADARDFADEQELIEDEEGAAAARREAAAARARAAAQLGLVAAALQVGGAAEEEDYDVDEGGEEEPGAARPRAPLAPPQHQLAAAPARRRAAPGAEGQLAAARARGIRLPVLGRTPDGAPVLRFSELFSGASVTMSGKDLRPPPLLPALEQATQRSAARRGAVRARGAAIEPEEAEEGVLRAAEVDAAALAQTYSSDEEEAQGEEEEDEEAAAAAAEAAEAAAIVAAAATAAQERAAAEVAAAAAGTAAPSEAAAARTHAALPVPVRGSGLVRLAFPLVSEEALAPVEQQEWERDIMWGSEDEGGEGQAGAGPAGQPEHEPDEEAEAAEQQGVAAEAAATEAAAEAGDGGAAAAAAAAASAEQQQQLLLEQGGVAAALPLDAGAAADAMQWEYLQQQQQWDVQGWSSEQQEEWAAYQAQQAQWAAYQAAQAALEQQQWAAYQAQAALQGAAVLPAGAAVAALGALQQQQQQQWGETPLDEMPGRWPSLAPGVGPAAGYESSDTESAVLTVMRRVPLLRLELDAAGPSGRLPLQAEAVEGPAWEARIAWDGPRDAERLRPPAPWLDLNDPGQTFELTSRPAGAHAPWPGSAAPPPPPGEAAALAARAAAAVLPPPPRAPPPLPKGADVDAANEAEVALARLNVSRDRDYAARGRRGGGLGALGRVHHSKLALELVTLPLLAPGSVAEMGAYHRPQPRWLPMRTKFTLPLGGARRGHGGKKGRGAGAGAEVTISSLAGTSKRITDVDLSAVTPLQLWQGLLAAPRSPFAPVAGDPLVLLLPERPPRRVVLSLPLAVQGAVREGDTKASGDVELTVTFPQLHLLPSAGLLAGPRSLSGSFQLRRELSAAEPGRVLLVEYLEQQPLLLNRPGMGGRLLTFYRKASEKDDGWRALEAAAKDEEAGGGSARWRYGQVVPFGADDDPPFLGDLPPSAAQLAWETGLSRSLAHPYPPPPSDFLLVRSPAGAISLRELTGGIAAGQQLPLRRIYAPGERLLKALEESRIYVYARLDKKFGEGVRRASIPLSQLGAAFPNRPEGMIRLYLKQAGGCDLVQLRDDGTALAPGHDAAAGEQELYGLREGARLPSEAELRKRMTPEDAIQMEASYVAAYRLKQRGIMRIGQPGMVHVAPEKVRLAAEMLPPEELSRRAARVVEQAVLAAPWDLTANFLGFLEGKAQLQITGAGDPTGRGIGYSLIRDNMHGDITKTMHKRQAGKVQGTDADLRRMTTQQAKERLIQYGLPEEEVEPLGRWVRIDLVRQLASAAALDGTHGSVDAKYVRYTRMTMVEQQKKSAAKAREVLAKQISVLNNTAGDDLGDQEELEAALEAELLQGMEEEEGDARGTPGAATPSGRKKGRRGGGGGSPAPEEEARAMQEMREEGLLASTPGGGAGPSGAGAAPPAPPAKPGDGTRPGERRIRREVLQAAGRGWAKVHEVVYQGRDMPHLLSSIYVREGAAPAGPWGFVTREVKGPAKTLKLSYAAARGRGVGRGGRGNAAAEGGSGGGRGRGRGRGRGGGAAAGASPPPRRPAPRARKKRLVDEDMIIDVEELEEELRLEEAEAAWEAREAAAAAAPRAPRARRARAAAAEAGGAAAEPDFDEILAATEAEEAAAAAAAAAGALPSPPAGGFRLKLKVSGGAAGAAAAPGAEGAAAAAVAPPPRPRAPKKPKKAAPKPQKDPSPEYVTFAEDLAASEEDEAPRGARARRRRRAQEDDDFRPGQEGGSDGGVSDFIVDDDDLLEEDDYLSDDGGPLRHTRSRVGAAPPGGGGRRRRASAGGGGGGRRRAKAGGGGGGGGRKRGRRSDEFDLLPEEFDEFSTGEDTGDEFEGGGYTPPPAVRPTRGGGKHPVGRALSKVVGELRKLPIAPGLNPKQWSFQLYFGKPVTSESAVVVVMVKRCQGGKYASRDDFRRDIAQIVANARAYNTPGHGQHGGPEAHVPVMVAATAALAAEAQQARTLAAAPSAAAGQRRAAQQQRQQYGGYAVVQEAAAEEEAGEDQQWAQCSACGKWRALSDDVYRATVKGATPGTPWHCTQNFDRPGASCADPDDADAFRQAMAAAGGQ